MVGTGEVFGPEARKLPAGESRHTSHERAEQGDATVISLAEAHLRRGGLDVGEYFLGHVSRDGNQWSLPLWHGSSFLPEHDGKVGNRSGRSRTLVVDPSAMKVVSDKLWR